MGMGGPYRDYLHASKQALITIESVCYPRLLVFRFRSFVEIVTTHNSKFITVVCYQQLSSLLGHTTTLAMMTLLNLYIHLKAYFPQYPRQTTAPFISLHCPHIYRT
jgi:hypothetical protein